MNRSWQWFDYRTVFSHPSGTAVAGVTLTLKLGGWDLFLQNMTRKTLNALNGSIAHWRRFATGTSDPDEQPIPEHCALCCEFLIGTPRSCWGCPVMRKSGQTACTGTPYAKADAAFLKYGKNSRQFKSAAKKELKFLISLLPKRRKKINA